MPVSSTPDEILVARMAARDQAALSTIYNRSRAVVFSLALRILRDRAEAEEALADVFLQAWHQASGFDRARGPVGAWLITLCRSRAIDRLRARGRRDTALDIVARAGGGQQDEPPPVCRERAGAGRRPDVEAPADRRGARRSVRRSAPGDRVGVLRGDVALGDRRRAR